MNINDRFLNFIKIYDVVDNDTRSLLAVLPCPKTIAGKQVAQDLSGIKLANLIDLQVCKTDVELINVALRDIAELDARQMATATIAEVFGFVDMISREVKRISELFKSVAVEPTEDERKAGIEQLQFGLFGLLDWYAKRMGMTDQDQVLQVNWQKVYRCSLNDKQQIEYQRRLQKVMADKYATKQ